MLQNKDYGTAAVDDINFHETCDLSGFESDKVITMPAPDGEVTALNYRISDEFELPFKIFTFIERADNNNMRYDLLLKVKAEYPDNRSANNFVARIPFSKNVISVGSDLETDPQNQSVEYKQSEKILVSFSLCFHLPPSLLKLNCE